MLSSSGTTIRSAIPGVSGASRPADFRRMDMVGFCLRLPLPADLNGDSASGIAVSTWEVEEGSGERGNDGEDGGSEIVSRASTQVGWLGSRSNSVMIHEPGFAESGRGVRTGTTENDTDHNLPGKRRK
jgi:hypothetical protein